MAPAQFKLAKRGNPTRRINFSTRPDWSTLSAKIATLFSIPNDNVAVSYIDADGDEITLSSDEELHDYYKTITPFPIPTIKFTVLDLRSQASSQIPVDSELPQATASQPSPFRNTFGGPETFPLVFEVDDEWQNLPVNLGSLFLPKDNPGSPHAFVELLESEISRSRNSPEPHLGDGDTLCSRSPAPEPLHNVLEKGKERAYEDLHARVDDIDDDDDTSTGSIIGNEAPHKPPVHVFDVSDTDLFGRSTKSFARSGAATPAQAQSTPVLSEQTLKDVAPALTERVSPWVDDAPLPNIDPNAAAPSLTHDVAAVLTTFSNVVTSHPELLEGIRQIVSNTTSGTYWAAHREALSRAAGNIQRTATAEAGRTIEEIRRTAEEEAGARVAEALGRVFRTFSHDQGNRDAITGDTNTARMPNSDEQPHMQSPDSAVPPPHSPHSHRGERRSSWFNFAHHHHRPAPFWAAYPPPPPPPPLPPVPRNWPRPPSHRFWGRSGVDFNEPAPEARAPAAETYSHGSGMAGVVRVASTPVNENLAPEELRANLERAKAEYKLSKERYRKAKTIRKMSEHRHRDRHETSVESPDISRQVSDGPAAAGPGTSSNNMRASNINMSPIPVPEPVSATIDVRVASPVLPEPVFAGDVHIVSNARGPYPQLEMFEVPRRGHTISRTGHRHTHSEARIRALHRIMRKLSDMGFTEGSHPNLHQKVMDQLTTTPPTGKDVEDDIVTNLIEELIPSTSNPTHAGPSRDGGIPGSWH